MEKTKLTNRKTIMDKYKIQKTEDGEWAVLTRDYFWQRWRPYRRADGEPVVAPTIDDALRSVGSAWWKVFWVRVNSIGVF